MVRLKRKKGKKTPTLHTASDESSVASVLPQLTVSLYSKLLLQIFSLSALLAFSWGLRYQPVAPVFFL